MPVHELPEKLDEKFQPIAEEVSEDDRRWFERHPKARWRWRRYVVGEDGWQARMDHGVEPTHTLVLQLAPGARSRTFHLINPAAPPREVAKWQKAQAKRELRAWRRAERQRSGVDGYFRELAASPLPAGTGNVDDLR